MRDHLRRRPVRVAKAAARQACRRHFFLAHLRALQMHLHADVEAALLLIFFRKEIRQGPGIVRGARKGRAAEGLERLERHDPRRHSRCEALGEERPERLVFPGLDIARRPVVEEHDAEDMVEGLLQRDAFPQRISRADDEGELGLVVEAPARAERRAGLVRRFCLAAGAYHGSARDHHRRGAAVVADRQPLVVRQQRVVGAEQPADVGGVEHRGVEVGVIADRHRQEQLGALDRHQVFFKTFLFLYQCSGDFLAQAFPRRPAHRGKAVQRRPALHAERGEVEDLVADGDAGARLLLRIFPPEDAERQVLDREVAARRVR